MKRSEMLSLSEWLIVKMKMNEHKVHLAVALLELWIRSHTNTYCLGNNMTITWRILHYLKCNADDCFNSSISC